MYPVPSQCPICSNNLTVTEVSCDNCHTKLSGHFSLGRLQSLTPDQLKFVEVFIMCEGKINRVEQELGMSYPAVRSQLQEVITALEEAPAAKTRRTRVRVERHRGGYPAPAPAPSPAPSAPPAPPAVSDDKRREILARVSAGEITAQEAAALLRKES